MKPQGRWSIFPHMLPEKRFRSYPTHPFFNQTGSPHPCLCIRQHPATRAQRDGYNDFMVVKDRGGRCGVQGGEVKASSPEAGAGGSCHLTCPTWTGIRGSLSSMSMSTSSPGLSKLTSSAGKTSALCEGLSRGTVTRPLNLPTLTP